MNLRPALLTLAVVRGHGSDASRRKSFNEWAMMREQPGWGLWKVEFGRGTFLGIGGWAEQSFATAATCEQGREAALALVDRTLFGGMRPIPGMVREPWGYTQELSPGWKKTTAYVCAPVGDHES